MFRHRIVWITACALLWSSAGVHWGWAQSNSKEIMALGPAQLVELLKKSDSSEFEKAKACQRLAVVGGADAIPALAALLSDEKLNLYARFGLEAIPDPAVDTALRDAATKLQGRQQIGVINSIGQRRDAGAVELLKGLLAHSDAAVAGAAAGALGRIGTSDAASLLREALAMSAPVKNDVADASLACAEGLAAAGKKDEAAALYQTVAQADLPKHLHVAALTGHIRLLGAEGAELAIAQLCAEDPALFNVGLAAVRQVPGAEAGTTLAGVLDKLPPARQALLLRALGDRQEGVPMPRIEAAAKSAVPEVREAAVAVLAKRGEPSAVPILMEAALGAGQSATDAKEGLKALKAADVDALILARLAESGAKDKVVLLEIAAARRIAAALDVARQAMTAADESVRLAAIAALGQLVELKEIDVLIGPAFASGDTAEKKAAQESLRTAALRLADREGVSARLGKSLAGMTPEGQVFVLELLGRLAGPSALETVVQNARSSDDALKDAATRVLGDWPNPSAAAALLNIARTDRDLKYQIRALRGYIRIARQLQLPDDEKLKMFHTAMGIAKRTDEQRLALDILSRIPSAETLQLAASYVSQEELKNEAADAAVTIARLLIRSDPQAVERAMLKVVNAKVGGKPGNQARQLLNQAKGSAT